MNLHSFIGKIWSKHTQISTQKPVFPEGDFVDVITKAPKYFAEIESSCAHKSIDESMTEIEWGLSLLDIPLSETHHGNKTIVLIPPKYDFWSYVFIAINLCFSGYRVFFLYHGWSKKLVSTMRQHLQYLKYQNLSFSPIANIDTFTIPHDTTFLNFYEKLKGIPLTIPSFTTVVVSSTSDLDYAIAYILEHAFAFTGLKSSSLKRVIVDSNCKSEFDKRLHSRLSYISNKNSSKVTSSHTRKLLHELVVEAISEGADMPLGGAHFDEEHVNNVILNYVNKDMRIFQKKFYGPLLQIAYSSFDPKDLHETLKQQPSKGIIVVSAQPGFIELHDIAFNGYKIITRPAPQKHAELPVIESNPALELMIKSIKL